jgi:hypothetical protein
MKILTDPFDVLDALGGNITGDYQVDLKRLNTNGRTCSESVYDDAYQMFEQP